MFYDYLKVDGYMYLLMISIVLLVVGMFFWYCMANKFIHGLIAILGGLAFEIAFVINAVNQLVQNNIVRVVLIIAGVIASVIGFYFLLGLCDKIVLWRRSKEKEKQRIQAEKKRIEELRRIRALSIPEQMAILDENYKKNLAFFVKKLKDAESEYKEMQNDFGNIKPETMLQDYRSFEEENDAFRHKIWDAFSGSGVEKAKNRVEELQDIAKYFTARYNTRVYEAKIENEKYMYNNKKAILSVSRLKEIYEKLTKKQKERIVENIGKKLHIENASISVPESFRGIDTLALEYKEKRKADIHNAIGTTITKNIEFREKNRSGDPLDNVAVFAASIVAIPINGAIAKHENNTALKDRLRDSQDELYKRIAKIEKSDPDISAFTKRLKTINMALKKDLSSFETFYDQVYATLYPEGIPEKSKKARKENVKNGGTYFTDVESDAIIELGTIGKYLLGVVDIKFEGGES